MAISYQGVSQSSKLDAVLDASRIRNKIKTAAYEGWEGDSPKIL